MAEVWYTIEAAPLHRFNGIHPERPERVRAVEKHLIRKLQLGDVPQARQLFTFPIITEEQLLAVHSREYVEDLRASLAQVSEPTALRDAEDPDGCTYATGSTWDDALRAASSAVALVDVILRGPPSATGSPSAALRRISAGGVAGSADSPPDGAGLAAAVGAEGAAAAAAAAAAARPPVCGFSICRPPGHHATATEGMGFCLLNNAAIAARHAQRAHGLQRMMILDWDVHHGNGTQAIFYEDPSVLFIDLHQDEVWPGTGGAEESGAGEGEGTTVNVPLPLHSGHVAAQRAFERVVVPAARRFGPELIIVSAGYDAHWQDPLEQLQLQSATYHWLGAAVRQLAAELCGGRLLLLLEGGYNTEALADSVGETMLGLLGRPPATTVNPAAAMAGHDPEPLEQVEAVIRRCRRMHGLTDKSSKNNLATPGPA